MKGSNETSLMLFFNSPTSFHFLLLFFNLSSILLSNFFHLTWNKLLSLSNCEDIVENYGHSTFLDDEDDHGFFTFQCTEKQDNHLVADIIHGGESLVFLPSHDPNPISDQVVFDRDEEPLQCFQDTTYKEEEDEGEEFEDEDAEEEEFEDELEHEEEQEDEDGEEEEKHDDDNVDGVSKEGKSLLHDKNRSEVVFINEHSPEYFSQASQYEQSEGEEHVMILEEHIDSWNTKAAGDSSDNGFATPIQIDLNNSGPVQNDDTTSEEEFNYKEYNHKDDTEETKLSQDGNYFVLETKELETKKVQLQQNVVREVFGESCTEGSTSKSSSEWRNSISYRDSGTEDPFSSSSRRSCPTWESYAVFRKYDEEMLFFDRITAQKLSETESLRAIEMCPKSISQRIMHKLTTKSKCHESGRRNPYQELETAYVAQICLTWEALNWNYKNFQRVRATHKEEDPGMPGQVAQQFQQFQVLLQRFIENEPYEHGRRPEVYARMRKSAPNLLQVPEFRDLEDGQKKEGLSITVSSRKFEGAIEDAIRTFMNFLKADKKTPCDAFKAFFKRNQRKTVDPTYLHLMKKSNKRKKMKIKDLCRARKCLIRRRLKEDDAMEIMMSLIDLKVVSRVLRMNEISEEQLHWCEEKMNKVRVREGKLHRDSAPIFFPTH